MMNITPLISRFKVILSTSIALCSLALCSCQSGGDARRDESARDSSESAPEPSIDQTQADRGDLASAPITFGVVPQQAPSKIIVNWRGFAQALGRSLKRKVIVKTAPSIPEFERRVARGAYDIAYMNPYHYTVFAQRPGYRAFAKQRDKVIKGILVVRRDSPYQRVGDLKGKSAAFPSPAAFAASVLTRAHFRSIDADVKVSYVKSHDSVYRSVAGRIHDVGGGVIRTFKSIPSEIRDQLRVLWTSPPHTPHAFAYHPRASSALRDALKRAVAELAQLKGDDPIFKPIKFKGLSAAADGDWDDVRALKLNELDHLLSPSSPSNPSRPSSESSSK